MLIYMLLVLYATLIRFLNAWHPVSDFVLLPLTILLVWRWVVFISKKSHTDTPEKIVVVALSVGLLTAVLLIIMIFIGPRQGLRLSPPGEHGHYLVLLPTLILFHMTTLYFGAIPRMLMRGECAIAALACIGLGVYSQFHPQAPVQRDLIVPFVVGVYYALSALFMEVNRQPVPTTAPRQPA